MEGGPGGLEAPPPPTAGKKGKRDGDGEPEDELGEKSPLLDIAAKHVDEYLRVTFGKDKPKNSALQTVVLLVNSSIGSGILNQPYVFYEAGIGAACVLYPIGALVTWAGLYMLVESAQRTGANTYGTLAEAAFGEWGGVAVDVALVILCYGCLCSYLVTIGGLASALIETWSSSSVFFTSKVFITLMASVVLLPICLARHYGHMVPTASYSLVAISLVVILVLAYGMIQGSSDQSDGLNYFSLIGSLRSIGSIVFSLSCAHATFHVSSSMDDPSFATWNIAAATTVLISSTICFVTGLVGYISFRADTQGELMDNFTWVGAQAFKIFLIVHLLLYIAPDFIIMRYSTLTLCKINAETVSTVVHVSTTVLLLSSVVGLVVLLYLLQLSEGQAFSYLIDLTGATAATAISFLFPGAIAWKLYGLETRTGLCGALLCCFGIVVAIMVPIVIFT